MFAHIEQEHGKIDILVNNAGIASNEVIGMICRNTVKELFAVNVYGLLDCMQEAVRLMKQRASGVIINLSSIVGLEGVSGQAAYAAAKGAVAEMTVAAAKELLPYGIRVNAIAPGMIGTDRFYQMYESVYEKKVKQVGMKRTGTPNEVASACVFLVSEEAKGITGEILRVDGCLV